MEEKLQGVPKSLLNVRARTMRFTLGKFVLSLRISAKRPLQLVRTPCGQHLGVSMHRGPQQTPIYYDPSYKDAPKEGLIVGNFNLFPIDESV